MALLLYADYKCHYTQMQIYRKYLGVLYILLNEKQTFPIAFLYMSYYHQLFLYPKRILTTDRLPGHVWLWPTRALGSSFICHGGFARVELNQ